MNYSDVPSEALPPVEMDSMFQDGPRDRGYSTFCGANDDGIGDFSRSNSSVTSFANMCNKRNTKVGSPKGNAIKGGSFNLDTDVRTRMAMMEKNIEMILMAVKPRDCSVGTHSDLGSQSGASEHWNWDSKMWKLPQDKDKRGVRKKKPRNPPAKKVRPADGLSGTLGGDSGIERGISIMSSMSSMEQSLARLAHSRPASLLESSLSERGAPGSAARQSAGSQGPVAPPSAPSQLLQASSAQQLTAHPVPLMLPGSSGELGPLSESEVDSNGGGSVGEEEEEDDDDELPPQEDMGPPPSLFLPESLGVTAVEGSLLIMTTLEALMVIYEMSLQHFDQAPQSYHTAILAVATVTYAVFISMQFFTARLVGWTLMDESRKSVAWHYLRSWFAFDVAVCFPLDLIVLGISTKAFRVCQAFRILKLLRSFSLFRTSNPLHERRYTPAIAFIWIVFLHHICACIHLLIKGGGDTWREYVDSLYWTVQTTTSVGYGDLEGQDSTRMRTLSIVYMFVGSGFYGWFLGNVSVYFLAHDHLEQKQKQRRAMVLSLMNRYAVPLAVQKEAFCIYPFIFGEGASSNYTEILKLFPPYMQLKIGLQVRLKLLRQVPMFKTAEDYILTQLARKLTRLMLEPDRTVIEIDEVGREMFFISSGAVEVLVRSGNSFKQIVLLRDGSWFGEIAILKESRRTAAVRTVTVCEVLMLTKADFLVMVRRYPNSVFAKSITEEVERRIRALGHDVNATPSPDPALSMMGPSRHPSLAFEGKGAQGKADNTEADLARPFSRPGGVLKDKCFDLDEFVSSAGSEDDDPPVIALTSEANSETNPSPKNQAMPQITETPSLRLCKGASKRVLDKAKEHEAEEKVLQSPVIGALRTLGSFRVPEGRSRSGSFHTGEDKHKSGAQARLAECATVGVRSELAAPQRFARSKSDVAQRMPRATNGPRMSTVQVRQTSDPSV